MKRIYEAPELNIISYLPAEKLANSVGFNDIPLGNNMTNQEAPIESTDMGIDF